MECDLTGSKVDEAGNEAVLVNINEDSDHLEEDTKQITEAIIIDEEDDMPEQDKMDDEE